MFVYEAGIVYHGIVLVSREYYPIKDAMDADLRASMLTALLGFAGEMFRSPMDTINALRFQKYALVFNAREVKVAGEVEPLYCYVVVGRKASGRLVKKIKHKMDLILELFWSTFATGNTHFTEVSQFLPFQEVIDDFFKDIPKNPEHTGLLWKIRHL